MSASARSSRRISRRSSGRSGDQPLDAEAVRAKFAELAAQIAPPSARAPRRSRSPRASCRSPSPTWRTRSSRSRCRRAMTSRRFALQCFGGAGGPARLPRRRRAGHGDGVHPPLCRRAVAPTAWGWPTRRAMREQAVEVPLDRGRCRGSKRWPTGWRRTRAAALAARAPTRRESHAARHAASALRRHRGGADRAAARRSTQVERATSPLRTARASASRRPSAPLIVEAVAVEARRRRTVAAEARAPRRATAANAGTDRPRRDVHRRHGGARAPVLERDRPAAGDRIAGPALIREANATTVVEPGWSAEVTALDHMMLRRTERRARRARADRHRRADPVLLELFNNLFMNVAEQTGAVLQNTSMSVNIKERLDFSCAIFDAERRTGRQCAARAGASRARWARACAPCSRAPPRHAEAGRRRRAEQSLQRRHASARRHGHHAGVRRDRPRQTVLRRQPRPPRRYRRHHARLDAAGCRARWRRRASSSTISCWSTAGHFREAEFRALLAGGALPGAQPDVNVADIKAQVAANEKGVQELRRVVAQFGWRRRARLYAPRHGQRRGERCAG